MLDLGNVSPENTELFSRAPRPAQGRFPRLPEALRKTLKKTLHAGMTLAFM